MKTLLLRNLSIISTLLAIAAFMAFSASVFIEISLFSTGIKTYFLKNFFLLLSVLSIISLATCAVKNFLIFKEAADLHKKWKIPLKDIIEGIYTYKINHYHISAEKFQKCLKEKKENSNV